MPNNEALADQAAGDGAGTDVDPARQAAVLDEIFGPEPVARPGAVPFDWRVFLASIPPSNRVRASRAVARAPILRAIEQRELLDMRRRARMRSYQAGAVIAGETDGVTHPSLRDGGTVHVVVTGWCKAIRSHPAGDRVIVEIRGPREIAGLERLALAWGPHPTGPMGELPAWVALGPLETVPLSAFDVRMAVECSRLPYLEMQPLLAQRVLELEGLTLQKLRPTDERLLAGLRSLAVRYGTPAGRRYRTMPVPLTQGDMAALVGATRETTNRALRRLAAEGDVELHGGRVTLVRLPPPASSRAARRRTLRR